MLLPPLYHNCASFSRPIPSIERSLWQPLCLHSATTATLEPPLEMVLHPLCFLCATCCATTAGFSWWFKEGTRVVLWQLHRNITFWVGATSERPDSSSGRSKVPRRSQPCAKGALATSRINAGMDFHEIFRTGRAWYKNTVYHQARVTVFNFAKMAQTGAPFRDYLDDLMIFLHRICRNYLVCHFLASYKL